MKKRNLLLVIPALLLVFGLVLSCGDNGGGYDGPGAAFYGTYTVNYSLNDVDTDETIVFAETSFEIYEADPDGIETATQKLIFAIDEDGIDEFTDIPDNLIGEYPNAFYITGVITDAKPVNVKGQNGASQDSLYGSQTAPGATKADIDNATPFKMLILYNDSSFVRTPFLKSSDSFLNTDGSLKIVKTAESDQTKRTNRVYTRVEE